LGAFKGIVHPKSVSLLTLNGCQWLMVAIDCHIWNKILWKSMATFNCLVTNILCLTEEKHIQVWNNLRMS